VAARFPQQRACDVPANCLRLDVRGSDEGSFQGEEMSEENEETGEPEVETPTADKAESVADKVVAKVKKAAKPKKKPKRKTVKALEAELAEANDRLLRARAEFDNYRKRVQRDMADLRAAAQIGTIEELLPVLDHFNMAMAAANTSDDLETLRQGMNMIQTEFERRLESLGVNAFETNGQPFDPKVHEAMSTEASADVPADHIVSTWKPGYMFGDRLLRPAAVVVSSGPAADEEV
jgi:molecular chaperone GrpE